MSRHSRNNTASAVFTYHERKLVKDAGTVKERLGRESLRSFESCWLCLRPAIRPVCTPRGFVFCRDCVILSFGEQKKRQNANKINNEKIEKKLSAGNDDEIARFIASQEKMTLRSSFDATPRVEGKVEKEDYSICSKSDLTKNVFWISENMPSSTREIETLTKRGLSCPISGLPLRMKELVDLKPEVVGDDSESLRWVCAISKNIITHQSAVAIKQTGQIVTKECAMKFVVGKKGFLSGMVKPSDLIPLIPGGTGFASHNKVEADTFKPPLS